MGESVEEKFSGRHARTIAQFQGLQAKAMRILKRPRLTNDQRKGAEFNLADIGGYIRKLEHLAEFSSQHEALYTEIYMAFSDSLENTDLATHPFRSIDLLK